MKQIRQILAILGIVVLVAMYTSTLVFAFLDHSASLGLLKASIACTIFVPVLLYGFTLFSRLLRMIRTAIIRAAHPTDPSLADFDSSPIQSKTVHPTGSSRGCTVCLFARTFVSHNRLIYFISCQTKEKDRISVRPALFVLMAFFFFLFLFSFVQVLFHRYCFHTPRYTPLLHKITSFFCFPVSLLYETKNCFMTPPLRFSLYHVNMSDVWRCSKIFLITFLKFHPPALFSMATILLSVIALCTSLQRHFNS